MELMGLERVDWLAESTEIRLAEVIGVVCLCSWQIRGMEQRHGEVGSRATRGWPEVVGIVFATVVTTAVTVVTDDDQQVKYGIVTNRYLHVLVERQHVVDEHCWRPEDMDGL